MSASEFDYLCLAISALTVFAAVLGWTEWYSNRS